MEKNGMLSDQSQSDYDNTKKAEYYDALGFNVADEANKHKLQQPEPVNSLQQEEKQ